MDRKNELMTLSETAQLLGTTEVNVLMHARKSLLEQVDVDGLWYITTESFERYVSQNGNRKSNDVCTSGCSRATSCSSHCG